MCPISIFASIGVDLIDFGAFDCGSTLLVLVWLRVLHAQRKKFIFRIRIDVLELEGVPGIWPTILLLGRFLVEELVHRDIRIIILSVGLLGGLGSARLYADDLVGGVQAAVDQGLVSHGVALKVFLDGDVVHIHIIVDASQSSAAFLRGLQVLVLQVTIVHESIEMLRRVQ